MKNCNTEKLKMIFECLGWTRKLTEFGGIITDDHPDLLPFCNSLERCLEKGVAVRPNSFGLPREFEAWNWIKQLALLNERHKYLFLIIKIKN